MNRNSRLSPLSVFLLILLLSVTGIALARAGGGQSYGVRATHPVAAETALES
jgi:hypothetical protein